jgi:hypothetical protein
MDGFELHMNECRFDQWRQIFLLAVREIFERSHAIHNILGWRGHKRRVAWSCAANPVLTCAEFSGTPLAVPTLGQKNLVNFPNQPQRERKILSQSAKAVIHRRDAI